jgi:hypothetical protein
MNFDCWIRGIIPPHPETKLQNCGWKTTRFLAVVTALVVGAVAMACNLSQSQVVAMVEASEMIFDWQLSEVYCSPYFLLMISCDKISN